LLWAEAAFSQWKYVPLFLDHVVLRNCEKPPGQVPHLTDFARHERILQSSRNL
jgi:hypothetical protein